MMDAETWMNAQKALELGFCDEVLYQPEKVDKVENSFTFSRRAVNNCLLDKLKACIPKEPPDPQPDPIPEVETVPDKEPDPEPTNRVNASDLEKRLARFQYV
jgi:ATP-dependent Clp protease protease subunit